jgi:hypothetical protein
MLSLVGWLERRARPPPDAVEAGPILVRGEGAADLPPETLAAIAVAVIRSRAASGRPDATARRDPGRTRDAGRWLAATRAQATLPFTRRR